MVAVFEREIRDEKKKQGVQDGSKQRRRNEKEGKGKIRSFYDQGRIGAGLEMRGRAKAPRSGTHTVWVSFHEQKSSVSNNETDAGHWRTHITMRWRRGTVPRTIPKRKKKKVACCTKRTVRFLLRRRRCKNEEQKESSGEGAFLAFFCLFCLLGKISVMDKDHRSYGILWRSDCYLNKARVFINPKLVAYLSALCHPLLPSCSLITCSSTTIVTPSTTTQGAFRWGHSGTWQGAFLTYERRHGKHYWGKSTHGPSTLF